MYNTLSSSKHRILCTSREILVVRWSVKMEMHMGLYPLPSYHMLTCKPILSPRFLTMLPGSKELWSIMELNMSQSFDQIKLYCNKTVKPKSKLACFTQV